MNLYSITSDLHGEFAHPAKDEAFIKSIEEALGEHFCYKDQCFDDYGSGDEDIIYIRTGGTEGIFKSVFCKDGVLSIPGGKKVKLLTSGKSNSLAASMEILSYLCQSGYPGEIIHGSSEDIVRQLTGGNDTECQSQWQKLSTAGVLKGKRYGVVGKPSDWLISSNVDYKKALDVLGAEIVDIPMETLTGEYNKGVMEELPQLKQINSPKFGRTITGEDFDKALHIYSALKRIVKDYSLDGLTLRCFDLLGSLGTTGCMGLAILNSEGIIGTCEGDVPAMLSMAVAKQLTGLSSFQVNLSKAAANELLFAHCTVPLDMVKDYVYDTHFESGIGVAVHGEIEHGKGTIIKIGADLEHYIVKGLTIDANQYESNLCRTQIIVHAETLKDYMLHQPLGNHHVIIPGDHVEAIKNALTK